MTQLLRPSRNFMSLSATLRSCTLLATFVLAMVSNAIGNEPLKVTQRPFLIGGFADGIYVSVLNLDSGEMTTPKLAAKVYKPAFMCMHPRLPVVYCVTETMQKDAEHPATITSFSYDADAMSLTKINSQSVEGDIPCYVSTTLDGKFALVANYTSGSVAVYPIADNGELKSASDLVVHEGKAGPSKDRQEKAHAHSILPDPSGKWIVAADLGLDQVRIYQLDTSSGKLKPAPTPSFDLPPGSGPRHISFHPDENLAFIINELASTLTSARWDPAKGTMSLIETQKTIPDSFEGHNTTAEVLIHPLGGHIFSSNRGHDSITTFELNLSNGRIRHTGNYPTGGKTPRNFRIDPTGQFMLVENQDSDTIHSMLIGQTSGKLLPTGHVIKQPMPACIKFIPAQWLEKK